jgi:hypothetical protein
VRRGIESLRNGRGVREIEASFRSGPVLAERYHRKVLKGLRQVRNALAYVLRNAHRHAAKRIARLREQGKAVKPLGPSQLVDVSSSARWFDGWRDDVKVDRSAPAAAPPRTWSCGQDGEAPAARSERDPRRSTADASQSAPPVPALRFRTSGSG